MKDRKYFVLDQTEHTIEYVIEAPGDEDIYTLRRSVSSTWSSDAQGEEIMTVLNSGDGYKIKWNVKPGKVMDYSQALELNIMLNFLNKYNSCAPLRYTIVDQEDVQELL